MLRFCGYLYDYADMHGNFLRHYFTLPPVNAIVIIMFSSVCLSVCNALTFESLDLEGSSSYPVKVKVKITGAKSVKCDPPSCHCRLKWEHDCHCSDCKSIPVIQGRNAQEAMQAAAWQATKWRSVHQLCKMNQWILVVAELRHKVDQKLDHKLDHSKSL